MEWPVPQDGCTPSQRGRPRSRMKVCVPANRVNCLAWVGVIVTASSPPLAAGARRCEDAGQSISVRIGSPNACVGKFVGSGHWTCLGCHRARRRRHHGSRPDASRKSLAHEGPTLRREWAVSFSHGTKTPAATSSNPRRKSDGHPTPTIHLIYDRPVPVICWTTSWIEQPTEASRPRTPTQPGMGRFPRLAQRRSARGGLTSDLTDRRRNPALATNPASDIPAPANSKQAAAARVERPCSPISGADERSSIRTCRPACLRARW